MQAATDDHDELATRSTVSVSVVMPAYGHADFILASLGAVLSQSTPPREVIVVDDSSPDETAALVAPLAQANRIRYVRQPNAGMAHARNAGAGLATSEYLYFLDDDDLVFPGALEWLVKELDEHPEAAMAFGDKVLFSDQAPPVPTTWSETQAVDRVPFMLFNQLGTPGQVLIRRSAFLAVGGFDATIWGTDDWDLWLRLLERYPARSAHRPVLAYRVHPNNASRNVARMYMSSLRVARRHLRSFPPDEQRAVRRFTYENLRLHHAPLLTVMARQAIKRGDWTMAATAVRAWTLAWATNVSSYCAYKAYLIRQGRWRLPPDSPIRQVI